MIRRLETPPVRTRPRLRDLAVASGIVGAVAVVVGGSVLGGVVGAAYGKDVAISTAGVLGGEQAVADRLPSAFPADQHGNGGVDGPSSRLLGTKDGTRYWIALDRASNVCLLAQSTTSPALTGASCVSPGDLEATGASLRVDGKGWHLEAFLIPDSVDESALRAPWVAVADNLVTYTGDSAALPSIELRREPGASGAPFTLDRLAIGDEG